MRISAARRKSLVRSLREHLLAEGDEMFAPVIA
jgi:hypothetical protein